MLFTDLVGSTELRSRLGDRAADDIRHAHDHAFAVAVEACSGRVVKGLGDGGMAVFPACADALDAAVAVQRAIHEINRARRAPEPVGLRVGISAGDVTWEAGDCFGTPVIEANRLCDEAASGEIICAEAVRWLARGRSGLVFRSLGGMELKGLPDPVPAAVLEWAPAPSLSVPLPPWTIGRDETSFVGRTAERDRLLEVWKEAETGERRFLVVSGEPGIGKTRLSVELARTVIDRGGVALAGRCDEDLAVPFQPFAEAIRSLVDHVDGNPRPVLGRFATDLAPLVPGLAARMGAADAAGADDTDSERWRLFDAVASCIQGLAADQPVLLLLDDLHWASRPTLQLLGHVLRTVERVPLLVLATYRDTELRRTHPLAEALADLRGRVGVERVSLRGLSSAEVVALLESAAGHDLGPNGHQLAAAICEETEGNPFFVGEVTRNLVESGRVYERDGRWVVDGSIASLGIPEGVREVIGRRLSRLSAASNDALVIGSVVGSLFDRATVEAAGGGTGEALDDALDEAVDAG
ncbi:MAG: ATP-binding protein, partial [Acidimicrobiales bacterium]